METAPNTHWMPYAPTEMEEDLYPESDGKPMADTDLHDPERRYLPSPLLGFRIVEGQYVEIPPDAEGRIHSKVLNLDFALLDDGLAIYDPQSEQWLQTLAEKEAAARQKAEAEAEKAKAEVARLQAELARLKERI